MAEIMGKMGEMEKEIKRLRHHVSVLSKRNHQLMKDSKSRAASPVASDVSLSEDEDKEEEEGKRCVVRVAKSRVEAEEFLVEQELGSGKCLRKGLFEAGRRGLEKEAKVFEVEAESVASGEVAKVALPVVRLPKYENEKGKRRRLEKEEEVKGKGREVEKELIAPLGPRAECGGLMRRVGRESVFAGADPRYVAGGGPSKTAPVGLSRGTDARRQSPGVRGGYLLRPKVGGYGVGYGGRGRGRGV